MIKDLSITVKDDPSDNPAPPLPENHAPVDLALIGDAIQENAANASVVGHLSAQDPDGDNLTYALIDNAGGRFGLQNGALVVKDGSRLDFELNQSHDIKVQVTDSHGGSTEKTFTIHVKDVADNLPDVGTVIVGTAGADALSGKNGNDTISGGSGIDKLMAWAATTSCPAVSERTR